MKSTVFIKPIEDDLKGSIRECFEKFGGLDSIIKDNVFIKINAATSFNQAMTDPDVILTLIEVIKEAKKKPKNIYVMDNCTASSCTRLVFKVNNLAKRIKKLGAKPLYLDEEKPVNVDFNGVAMGKAVPIPEILYKNLIINRRDSVYINVPKIKSHIFSKVSICIKNQYGLLYDDEKIKKHNQLNEKLADIMNLFQPDFNIVDAVTGIDYGPVAIYKDWIIPMGALVSGTDAVAVDSVCARFMGIDNVEHINIAAERGFGCNKIEDINIVPDYELVRSYFKKMHYDIKPELPESITIIRGKEQVCEAGCRYIEFVFWLLCENARSLSGDIASDSCVCIYGKGHDINEIEKYTGPFLINGRCAVSELKSYFANRKEKEEIEVYYIDRHFFVAKMFSSARKALKLPFAVYEKLSPLSFFRSSLISMFARFKGSRSHLVG